MLGRETPAASTGSTTDGWHQWRGPSRNGRLATQAPWPTSLRSPDLRVRWSATLGPSYSGPLIVGDFVYATEAKDRSIEAVVAFDRATGKERWRQSWEGYVKVPFFAKSNGDWIRSTPAWAGGRLYVGGMRDLLVCLDATTGEVLWRFDFPKQLGKPVPDFGFVSSPLVTGDAVFVQAGAGFAKVDGTTGKLVWRTLDDGGGMWGSAFGSPIRAELAGVEQLLVQTRDKLAGVRPDDGTVLWEQSIKAFRGMNILTPTTVGDRVLTSAYGGQTQGWTARNDGGNWGLRADWSLKWEAYMSSPVVISNHAIVHGRSQHLACIDLANGTRRWQSDAKFGKYMSLVSRGDQVLALDERGLLFLLRTTPEKLEILDERRVAESDSWAHVAIAGFDLAIRDLGSVALWTWEPAAPSGPAK